MNSTSALQRILDQDLDVLGIRAEGLERRIAKVDEAWTERVIATDVDYFSVDARDLDGDGDLDALVASSGDDTVAWHENLDGSGQFSDPTPISRHPSGSSVVSVVDLDGEAPRSQRLGQVA